jgi:hypothetical protein
MTTTNDAMNPYNDPEVTELLQSPAIKRCSRLKFLLGAAALLDQATTHTMPEVGKLYEEVLKLAQTEADKPDARAFIDGNEIWPRDADCFTKETAEPGLLARLANRPVGTKASIEHYDGDRYEVHASFVVGESGAIHRTPAIAAAAA